jgi:hypothetical protein
MICSATCSASVNAVVGDHRRHSLLSETLRHSTAEAACRSGDHCHLACELVHSPFPLLVFVLGVLVQRWHSISDGHCNESKVRPLHGYFAVSRTSAPGKYLQSPDTVVTYLEQIERSAMTVPRLHINDRHESGRLL